MTVRILFVEDSQDDVELQLRRLRDAGLEPQWDRVQTEEDASCRAPRRVLADRARRLQHPRVLGHRGPASHRRAGAGPAGRHRLREHRRGHGRGDHVGRRRGLRPQGQPHPAAPGGATLRGRRRPATRPPAGRRGGAAGALRPGSRVALDRDRGRRRHHRLRERRSLPMLLGMDREALIGRKLWELETRMAPEMWRGLWRRSRRRGSLRVPHGPAISRTGRSSCST